MFSINCGRCGARVECDDEEAGEMVRWGTGTTQPAHSPGAGSAGSVVGLPLPNGNGWIAEVALSKVRKLVSALCSNASHYYCTPPASSAGGGFR
jgi:hypothetical protein